MYPVAVYRTIFLFSFPHAHFFHPSLILTRSLTRLPPPQNRHKKPREFSFAHARSLFILQQHPSVHHSFNKKKKPSCAFRRGNRIFISAPPHWQAFFLPSLSRIFSCANNNFSLAASPPPLGIRVQRESPCPFPTLFTGRRRDVQDRPQLSLCVRCTQGSQPEGSTSRALLLADQQGVKERSCQDDDGATSDGGVIHNTEALESIL